MSADGSSRLVSSAAILGLVLIALLMVVVINSSSVFNPTPRLGGGNSNGPPVPPGLLEVDLISNENESQRISNPTADQQFPIEGKRTIVTPANSSAAQFTVHYLVVTNATGIGLGALPPGPYVVRFQVETLDVNIPIQVWPDNETLVKVEVLGTAYPVIYSEETGISPTTVGLQSCIFAKLGISGPVVSSNESVVLSMQEGTAGEGYLVNATVVSQQPPTKGTQWLELGTASAFDPANVTAVYLTTWRYSPSITVKPIGPIGP